MGGVNFRTYIATSLFLFLFLFSVLPSKATVTTHEIESSFKGYSIERIPGLDEFVAAGTYYIDDNGLPVTGYHFLHLDGNGQILASKIAVPLGDMELRVVDISIEDADNFWIVMSARDNSLMQDFIYAEKVNTSGNLGTAPNTQRAEGWVGLGYDHVYPTHSLVFNNSLYVCGYASNEPISNSIPSKTSLNKAGLIVKIDITTAAGLTTVVHFNTPPNSVDDFDMFLKMRRIDDYIIVTGAVNQSNDWGGIFIGKIHQSLSTTPPFFNYQIVEYHNNQPSIPGQNRHEGWYGIDAYEDGDDLYILCNLFKNNTVTSWGIVRVDPTTLQSPAGQPNVIRVSIDGASYAKQFYPHPDNNGSGTTKLYVMGELQQPFLYCSTPSQFQAPSPQNVNPFISLYDLSFDTPPGSGTGITWTNYFTNIHASDYGTQATFLDYMQNSTGGGNCLEDVQRLYTPASGFVNGQQDVEFVMIPALQNASNPNHLNTKLIRMDASGIEPTCHNQWACNPGHGSDDLVYYSTTSNFNYNTWSYSNLQPSYTTRFNTTFTEDNCGNGVFKPTSVSEHELYNTIKLYPNPAHRNLSIDLNATEGEYEFILTDITGKQVASSANDITSSTEQIDLPQLSAGVYLATVTVNGTVYTEKVVIE